jgi:hypothetical protein
MSRLACFLVVALGLAASGCVTAQAKGEPGGPALAPPDPPPHTVVPVTIVEAPPTHQAPEGPAPVVVGKEEPSAARRQKPAEKPAEKPPEKPPDTVPAQPAAPPAPPLQTTTNATGVESEIRKIMRQAEDDLGRVDRETLKNPDRSLQFTTARRFLQEAEEALKVKNLVFAKELADKAATLAAALAQR